MKFLPFVLLAILQPFLLNSQRPGGFPGGGGFGQGSSVLIFGKVVDEKGAVLDYASILLLKMDGQKSTLLTGTDTDSKGEFSFENISSKDKIKLQINMLGYQLYEVPIVFTPGKVEIDLGKIVMKEDAQTLSEVKVTATAAAMKMDVDKRTFNVASLAVNAGGTGQDVLKTVPSVNVDIDGNVTLRNSSPTFLVDGRPTLLTPDQIPADAIESIEVMTNPGAKFDASGGTGGIINIVLKKNKKSGYNGAIRAGAESVGSANGSLDLNYRQNKVNFTLSTFYRYNKGITEGIIERNTLNSSGNVIGQTKQDNTDISKGNFKTIRLGVDYFISNKSTISIGANLTQGRFNPEITQYFTTNEAQFGGLNSLRLSDGKRQFDNLGFTLGYKKLFNTEGDEWTIDINYNDRKFAGGSDIETSYYMSDFSSNVVRTDLQKIDGQSDGSSIVIQTDLVKMLGKNWKLEGGFRTNLNDRYNDNKNFFYNTAQQKFIEIVNPTSKFENQDYVHAIYGTISKQVKKTGLKLGLRAESFAFDGLLPDKNQEFDYSYPISLFPSAFITHKLNDTRDLQFSFTRRVNRPNFFQIIPFADSSDKFNIMKGNPDLDPEFSSNLEIGHLKRYKNNNSLLTSLYYKHTDNLISNFLIQDPNGTLINTFVNANSSYSAGLEATTQLYLNKNIDINLNMNVYNSKIKMDNLAEQIKQPEALWSWFSKMNANIKLPKAFNLQISGQYQSKANIGVGQSQGFGPRFGGPQSNAQGYIDPYAVMDIALRKNFLKNKLIVILGVNDVFASRYNKTYSYNNFFNQYSSRITNPQLVRLNLNYNFGKQDAVLFKRKSKGAEEAPE
jgi:outer membrane receptor protein involved in Fe transport